MVSLQKYFLELYLRLMDKESTLHPSFENAQPISGSKLNSILKPLKNPLHPYLNYLTGVFQNLADADLLFFDTDFKINPGKKDGNLYNEFFAPLKDPEVDITLLLSVKTPVSGDDFDLIVTDTAFQVHLHPYELILEEGFRSHPDSLLFQGIDIPKRLWDSNHIASARDHQAHTGYNLKQQAANSRWYTYWEPQITKNLALIRHGIGKLFIPQLVGDSEYLTATNRFNLPKIPKRILEFNAQPAP